MPAYQPCDVGYLVDRLEREGALLADAAARAGLTAPVPSCPGWQVRNLLAHTGHVHRWAARIVAGQLTGPVDGPDEEEMLRQAPGGDALVDWYRDAHAALVRALRAAAPDVDCWSFLPAPSPLAFWARRQAHETAIHRVDAEQAAGGAAGESSPAGAGTPGGLTPHPARFAADGVDELLTGFLVRRMRAGRWRGRPGAVAIHADDGAAGRGDWLVTTRPDGSAVSLGAGPADCDVTGPAADLYLSLWNRAPAAALRVEGDAAFLADVGNGLRVRWG